VNIITTESVDMQTETWASDAYLAEHHNISDDQMLEIHSKVSEGNAKSYDEDDDIRRCSGTTGRYFFSFNYPSPFSGFRSNCLGTKSDILQGFPTLPLDSSVNNTSSTGTAINIPLGRSVRNDSSQSVQFLRPLKLLPQRRQ
jgi:hypothetical protein